MTVALPFFQGDVAKLRDLIEWIGLLGGAKKHSAQFVADAATQWTDCVAMVKAAKAVFDDVSIVTTPSEVTGWPKGSNAMFRCAAEEMHKRSQPFLWLEPDAIPLRSGWLDSIVSAYDACGLPFMGRKYRNNMKGAPESGTILSGIAVYPSDTFQRVGGLINERDAWDVSIASAILPYAGDTDLIQWLWGSKTKIPTFVDSLFPDSSPATLTLRNISQKAVLFHRNKDGTLIKLLKKRLFPSLHSEPFTVVLSFWRDDAALALETMEWMHRLGTPKTHPILLVYENGTPGNFVQAILKSAHKTFTKVHHSQYRRPQRGAFPPTVAFTHAAKTMQKMGNPFLWLEPDAIPIKPYWLGALQDEYDRCGQPFCGPIVPHRGHMNGTGIYPKNTPDLIPETMRSLHSVWDWKMKAEMIQSCHDCSDIFFHCWGEIDGKLNPIEGPAPNFLGSGLITQIPDTAVIMHRCKDGSLIEELSKTL